jgi:hypothetical protein
MRLIYSAGWTGRTVRVRETLPPLRIGLREAHSLIE